jgi:hypothetical protein
MKVTPRELEAALALAARLTIALHHVRRLEDFLAALTSKCGSCPRWAINGRRCSRFKACHDSFFTSPRPTTAGLIHSAGVTKQQPKPRCL